MNLSTSNWTSLREAPFFEHGMQKTARKLVKAQNSRELYHSRANYAKIQVQEFTLETVERNNRPLSIVT